MNKKLVFIYGFFRQNGINNTGKKVCRYKGGGKKKKYRFLNYKYVL
jgi:ribosomal protein L2